MTEPLLTIDNLAWSYPGNPVFTSFSNAVCRSDFIGVIGPNGVGKSTLLKLVNGVLTPDSGAIKLNGINLRAMTPRQIARKMAFVPQQTVFANSFTVLEVVLMGRFPHKKFLGYENRDDIEMARSILKSTGADAFEDRKFDTLSGGEKQRVILAAALAQQPDILLLDEPLTGLDMYYQLHILSLLAQLNTQQNLTIITALHDINLAGMFCNRIWLLSEPNTHHDGSPEQVLTPGVIASVFRVNMTPIHTDICPRWFIPDIQEQLP
jgi:iron complex transport system ATP-binding protein